LKRNTLFIILILIATLTLSEAHSDSLTGRRTSIPPDPDLATRLAVSRFHADKPFDVLALTENIQDQTTRSLYTRGIVLSSMGLNSRAAVAYLDAMNTSVDPGPWWNLALTRYLELLPGLSVKTPPPVLERHDTELTSESSLHMANYLYKTGRKERAYKILSQAAALYPEKRAIAYLSSARFKASEARWKESSSLLESIKPDANPFFSDVIYLQRGFNFMESGNYTKARKSFLSVPPGSPFAPEALHGHAWALIRLGDISGAIVRLEELTERHADSKPAMSGIIDLALCYRELELYEPASRLLQKQAVHLGEIGNWTASLTEEDFYTGKRLFVLLDAALNGTSADPEIVQSTGPFMKRWIRLAAMDPYVQKSSSLLDGIKTVELKKRSLHEKMSAVLGHIDREIILTDKDLQDNFAWVARLKELTRRLPDLNKNFQKALDAQSLDVFSTERTLSLLSKLNESRARLQIMENTVEKAKNFSSLIENLSSSVSRTPKEDQLKRIREGAYEGLLNSRQSLSDYKSILKTLEGRIFLILKSQAVHLETKTTDRIEKSSTMVSDSLLNADMVRKLLTENRKHLVQFRSEVVSGLNDLDGNINEQLKALQEKIVLMRGARLTVIAGDTVSELKEIEARVLFTAADIEITRMENNLRAMQERNR